MNRRWVAILFVCVTMVLLFAASCSIGENRRDTTGNADADADADADTDADGDADTDIDLPVDTSAVFNVDASISKAINTVGIVSWSVDRAPVDAARIEFGLDTEYGLSAPCDLNDVNFRTLLLGMKPSNTYHFRIRAVSEGVLYLSGDYSFTTRGLSTALVKLNVSTPDPMKVSPGYTITSYFGNAVSPGAQTVFILDRDGTYVWWYNFEAAAPVSRARMSADGRYMLAGTLNVGDAGTGAIYKISMDGLTFDTIALPKLHHDFTVLPDDTIAYIEFETGGTGKCDRIVERALTGETHTVYTLRDDFGSLATDAEWCHSNAIHYVPEENAYYLSVLDQNMIIKVDRASGALVWTLGGVMSDFSGVYWDRQHGHCKLENGNIVLFNNNTTLGGFATGPSRVLELALDEGTGRATEVWRYESNASSTTLGDAQRLLSGNTLVTYSNAGLIQEVNYNGLTVQSIAWATGGGIAYADRRASLYGSPDHY